MKRVFIAAAVLLLGAGAFAEDWASWRGPSGNGITTEKVAVWPKSAKVKWSAKLGQSYAAVAVKGKNLYTIGADDKQETVYCFDALTGVEKWKHISPHPPRTAQADPHPTASNATPVVDSTGKRVYTLSREGLALCLNAQTGKPIWEQKLASKTGAEQPIWGFAGSPLVLGNRVVYSVGEAGCAVNAETGEVLWKSGGAASGYSSPVLIGASTVVLSRVDGFVAVRPDTGAIQWRHPFKAAYDVLAADPVVIQKDTLLFVTEYGHGQTLKMAGATPVVAAEARDLGGQLVTPVFMGDHLYGNSKGFLRCVDWRTGKTLWGERGFGGGALIAAGGDLIILTENGELVAVQPSAEKYIEKARLKVMDGKCWTQPVLANGLIYCRNNEGDLVCVDLKVK